MLLHLDQFENDVWNPRSRRAALQVGDRDHLKVFATTDDAGCQLRRPYFKINHKAALAVAVMAMDITMDIQS